MALNALIFIFEAKRYVRKKKNKLSLPQQIPINNDCWYSSCPLSLRVEIREVSQKRITICNLKIVIFTALNIAVSQMDVKAIFLKTILKY